MEPVRFPPIGRPDVELGRTPATPASGPSFGSALDSALESVARVQTESDEATRMFARGQEIDLHSVLLQIEKADVSFRTMMEVRNKLLDAYREVMRMQI